MKQHQDIMDLTERVRKDPAQAQIILPTAFYNASKAECIPATVLPAHLIEGFCGYRLYPYPEFSPEYWF